MSATDWLPVYQGSLYAVADARPETPLPWCGFRLDGDPEATLPPDLLAVLAGASSGTLITAWNPMSAAQAAGENQAANEALAKLLAEAAYQAAPAFGASLPGTKPAWQEEGFFVRGWDLEQAISWGFYAHQRGLVHWTEKGVGLLFCRTASFVPCGAILVTDDARLAQEPQQA